MSWWSKHVTHLTSKANAKTIEKGCKQISKNKDKIKDKAEDAGKGVFEIAKENPCTAIGAIIGSIIPAGGTFAGAKFGHMVDSIWDNKDNIKNAVVSVFSSKNEGKGLSGDALSSVISIFGSKDGSKGLSSGLLSSVISIFGSKDGDKGISLDSFNSALSSVSGLFGKSEGKSNSASVFSDILNSSTITDCFGKNSKSLDAGEIINGISTISSIADLF